MVWFTKQGLTGLCQPAKPATTGQTLLAGHNKQLRLVVQGRLYSAGGLNLAQHRESWQMQEWFWAFGLSSTDSRPVTVRIQLISTNPTVLMVGWGSTETVPFHSIVRCVRSISLMVNRWSVGVKQVLGFSHSTEIIPNGFQSFRKGKWILGEDLHDKHRQSGVSGGVTVMVQWLWGVFGNTLHYTVAIKHCDKGDGKFGLLNALSKKCIIVKALEKLGLMF